MTTTLREAIPEALRNGVSGWVDDDLAIMRYWGFEVHDIAIPVEVQYGMRDVIVPLLIAVGWQSTCRTLFV